MDEPNGHAETAARLLADRVGVPNPPGEWLEVTQERIDRFAEVTLDDQFIHTDPERAAESPFGGTIAHGMLTLSLIRPLLSTAPADPMPSDGLLMEINYGFDRVRFVEPVPSGSRIRASSAIADVERRGTAVHVVQEVVVERDGADRPVLVAEWIGRLVYDS